MLGIALNCSSVSEYNYIKNHCNFFVSDLLYKKNPLKLFDKRKKTSAESNVEFLNQKVKFS